jgi:phage terminase Nu1 subunit (DNA packaging protein)
MPARKRGDLPAKKAGAVRSKKSDSLGQQIVTTAELAELVGVNQRTLQRMVKGRILRQCGRGRFILGDANRAFIKHLRESLDGSNAHEAAYREARARRTRADAEAAELDLRLRKKELHRSDDIEFILTTMVAAARSRMLAIPSRLMYSLVGVTDPKMVHQKIEAEVFLALNELSQYDRTKHRRENDEYLAKKCGCTVEEIVQMRIEENLKNDLRIGAMPNGELSR